MFDLESLKKYRLEENITQEELADRINTSASYISKIENKNINPGLNNIIRLAGELNICPSLLLNCNCVNCNLKIDHKERLECKMKTLNLLELYVNASKELVEFELNNFDTILEKDITFGDVSHLRKAKKL